LVPIDVNKVANSAINTEMPSSLVRKQGKESSVKEAIMQAEMLKLNLDGSTANIYDTLGKGIITEYGSPKKPQATGAHGMEWVDENNMWVAVPPAQKVFFNSPAKYDHEKIYPDPRGETPWSFYG
jgi:hypothetical protein